MDNLRAVSPDADAKVLCFDNDARDLDPGEFRQCPQFCFIDGEHTKSAVESDFDFCLKVSDPNAAIAFHDDYVTADAIQAVIDRLAGDKVPFRALKMGGQTFVIALRDCPVATDPLVLENSVDGLKWLRRCRTVGLAKAWLPVWLKPAAQSVFRAVAGRPAT